jgi:recombination protein RecR
MHYPAHLVKIIDSFKRLPGVGNRSAERFAFQLLDWKVDYLNEMAALLRELPHKLRQCSDCGCLIGEENCPFCKPERAAQQALCIIASSRDVFAIEQTGEFKGIYHVLGALLSPLDGIGPERLPIAKLKERIAQHQIREVVVALDATLEGDATALYLKRELEVPGLHISRLAFGLPIGSALDYVDGGTLARALSARSTF